MTTKRRITHLIIALSLALTACSSDSPQQPQNGQPPDWLPLTEPLELCIKASPIPGEDAYHVTFGDGSTDVFTFDDYNRYTSEVCFAERD